MPWDLHVQATDVTPIYLTGKQPNPSCLVSPRLVFYPNHASLLISSTEVYYHKNNALVSVFRYEDSDPILDAIITEFPLTGLAVVVLRPTRAHLYFADKETIIENFPFQTRKLFALPQGALFVRKSAPPDTPFVTLKTPLGELGAVVASSTSSFAPAEDLVWFPNDRFMLIAVTYNDHTSRLSFYAIRVLSHSQNPTKKITRRSLSRKSLAHIPEDAQSTPRRPLEQIPTNDDVLNAQSLRRDTILARLESISFPSSKNALKVFCIASQDAQAVVIVDKLKKRAEVAVFEGIDSPKLSRTTLIDCIDAIPLEKGYILVADSSGRHTYMLEPFSGSSPQKVVLPATEFPISELDASCGSKVSVKWSNGQRKVYVLRITPQDALTVRCLALFGLLFGHTIQEAIWRYWCAAVACCGSDWAGFVAAYTSFFLPESDMLPPASRLNVVSKTLEVAHELRKYGLVALPPSFCNTALLGLHLLREELKLNVVEKESKERIDVLLAQMAFWGGLPEAYKTYYLGDRSSAEFDTRKRFLIAIEPQEPLCLMRSLCSLFSPPLVPYMSFLQLCGGVEAVDELLAPRTYYILRVFEVLVSPEFHPQMVVSLMVEYGMDRYALDTYPLGISVALKEFLALCRNSVLLDALPALVEFLDRKDIARIVQGGNHKARSSNNLTDKDALQLIQSVRSEENTALWDGHAEAEELYITRLLFSEDRRFYEITRLLQLSKVQTVTLSAPPGTSEVERLEMQRSLSVLAAQRTLGIPVGRGALFLLTRLPILTERFPVPRMNFDTVVMPLGMTISLDREAVGADLLDWGYFHNGASAGMTIMQSAKNVVGSWIVFNRPAAYSAQHGGFLLALGLNGFLKGLEEWHIYNYLGPKHTHTSVGLLIGVSASSRGSMDVKLTKVLSVHVVALLPQGATDLNVALPVQTAGLIGIGLLYLETKHRRMSEILLSQIGNRISHNDTLIADESYRLAAGIALGYTNLGKGNELNGLNDTHITDQLLAMATSLKDIQGEEEYDKSAPGATIALGLIYLKTENEGVAAKLSVPETEKLMDYIRPDTLLLRTVAKSLILWSSIAGTHEWIALQVPLWLRDRYAVDKISELDSDMLPYFNCIGGACIAVALRYASSGNKEVSNVLLQYLDHVMRLTVQKTTCFDAESAQSELLVVQDAIALSLAIVVAGSGDLDTLRRLRVLHMRTTPNMRFLNYAASSLALGMLFMGSGKYAFENLNFAVAALLTAIYPAPSGRTECDVYLQALRHFWVMAAQPRCLVVRDVETNRPIETEVEVEMELGPKQLVSVPCLLPPLQDIVSLRTVSLDVFLLCVPFSELRKVPGAFERFCKLLTLYVQEREQGHGRESLLGSIARSMAPAKEGQSDVVDKLYGRLFEKQFTANEHQIRGNMIVANTRLEARSLARRPKNPDEMWNARLLFEFYERAEMGGHYLSSEFVEELRLEMEM